MSGNRPPGASSSAGSHRTAERHTIAGDRRATLSRMAENERSLDQRLEEIGAQLAWVRDYL
jgi:hypothetical protein